MSRLLCVIVCLLTLALCPTVTEAQVKDQVFEPAVPDTIPTIFSNLRWAQTFTVGITGTLTGVDVLVAQMFGPQPEDLDVTIYDTINGQPHAALTAPVHLPAATIPNVSHPATFSEYAFLHSQFALHVSAGDVLAIVVSTGPTSQYMWAGALMGGYERGQLYTTTTTTWAAAGSEDQVFRTYVATSNPPTANAGANQSVRPGTTVHLNGSGSSDDNTATNLLVPSWTLSGRPQGSQATLLGGTTMTPSFVPDVAGNYLVQLIVTDQDGLSSQPSQVLIGENPPPIVNAGPDKLVRVNQVVDLQGTANDPDGDPLTIRWVFRSKPFGSATAFSNPSSLSTNFVPDTAGLYVAELSASDALGAGVPSQVQITATTAAGFAAIQTQAGAALVTGLPAISVTSEGNRNALTNYLSNATRSLEGGDTLSARKQLQQAIGRVDGCALRGAVDGNGNDRDWITTCPAQASVYDLLLAALQALTP